MDDEKQVFNKLLKSISPQSVLAPMKALLIKARKPNMETVRRYKCDQCKNPILYVTDGVCIKGNVYVADPDSLGGIVGNNFPSKDSFKEDEVKSSVFCKTCFIVMFQSLFEESKSQVDLIGEDSDGEDIDWIELNDNLGEPIVPDIVPDSPVERDLPF